MGFCCAGHCAEFAVPIIVLAAHGDDTQHIAALEFGADDYLVEPLSAGVFLARVRTLLRRSQPGALIAQRELLRRGQSSLISPRIGWGAAEPRSHSTRRSLTY